MKTTLEVLDVDVLIDRVENIVGEGFKEFLLNGVLDIDFASVVQYTLIDIQDLTTMIMHSENEIDMPSCYYDIMCKLCKEYGNETLVAIHD